MDIKPFLDMPDKDPDLKFNFYAQALQNLINNTDPFQMTIGIFGGYGSGKSTLMECLKEKLDKEETNEYITVWFNPWQYEHEDNLLIPFLMNVRQKLYEITKDETVWNEIHDACSAILHGLTFEFGIAKISCKDMLDAEDKKKNDKNLKQYSSVYSDIIGKLQKITIDDKGKKRKIVVFIDDLDRCLPDKAFKLLEAIKAFIDMPGFVFIFGLDPRVIGPYLKSKFKDEFLVDGEEYLQKIFQVQFNLPTPDKKRYISVCKVLINSLPEKCKINFDFFKDYLPRTIRQFKRILNSMQIIVHILDKDKCSVNPDLLFAILIVRYRWPQLYNYLYANKNDIGLINEMESSLDPKLKEMNNVIKEISDIDSSVPKVIKIIKDIMLSKNPIYEAEICLMLIGKYNIE